LISDHVNLILFILPLFFLALRYATAPMNEPFLSRVNTLAAPIAVIAIFTFTNYDILYMAVVVLIANMFISYKLLDSEGENW